MVSGAEMRFCIVYWLDAALFRLNRWLVRFACKRLDVHWPIAVYVGRAEAKRRGALVDPTGMYTPHWDGYRCELCDRELDTELYGKYFVRGTHFLWARGLK